jgi:hypothetical protein
MAAGRDMQAGRPRIADPRLDRLYRRVDGRTDGNLTAVALLIILSPVRSAL